MIYISSIGIFIIILSISFIYFIFKIIKNKNINFLKLDLLFFILFLLNLIPILITYFTEYNLSSLYPSILINFIILLYCILRLKNIKNLNIRIFSNIISGALIMATLFIGFLSCDSKKEFISSPIGTNKFIIEKQYLFTDKPIGYIMEPKYLIFSKPLEGLKDNLLILKYDGTIEFSWCGEYVCYLKDNSHILKLQF